MAALIREGRLFETAEDAYAHIPPERRLDCVVFEVEVNEDADLMTPLRVIAPFSQHNIMVELFGVIPPRTWITVPEAME